MGREISVRSMAIRRRRCGTPKPACRGSPPRCWKISTKRRSISSRTTTTASRSPKFCRRAFRTCWSTVRRGIAVGMATNIPPHNLTEIIDATIHLIQHPDTRAWRRSWSSCRARISRPAASFWAGREFCDAYTTGRGQLKLRAKAPIEKMRQGPRADRRHRDSLPGEQVAPDRAYRRAGEREEDRRHRAIFATRAIATACASCSN